MRENKWAGRLLGIAAAVVIYIVASVVLVAISAPAVLGWIVILATLAAGLYIARFTSWTYFGVGLAVGVIVAPFLIVIGAVAIQGA